MASPRIRRIGTTRDQLGESPVWDDRSGRLYWIDSLAGVIHSLDPNTDTTEEFTVPAPIGSMALRSDGTAVLAMRNSFAHYDFSSDLPTPVASIGIDHPMVRLNDGKADPFGSFIAGTMHSGRATGESPLGGLYRLNRAGTLELLETDLGVTNGPCFSPDGRLLYLADSARRTIWAYDYAEHSPLANKRVFVETSALNSAPDGATVDRDGFLWSVLVHRGAIARWAPDGRIERIVEVPVRHPTSVAFGGSHLDTLYLTSISQSTHLKSAEPDAGGLFAIEDLGTRGLPSYTVAVV